MCCYLVERVGLVGLGVLEAREVTEEQVVLEAQVVVAWAFFFFVCAPLLGWFVLHLLGR